MLLLVDTRWPGVGVVGVGANIILQEVTSSYNLTLSWRRSL